MQKQNMIQIDNLTKDYGQGRGVFDLNLSVPKGEAFGLVGQNGAGKSTTMRLLMGFLKADQGRAEINGLDCWKQAAASKKLLGYVPGEIAFPDAKYGSSFLKMQLQMLKDTGNSEVNDLIQLFKIDTTANLKRMSKGMKQKMALVTAFMTRPRLLLLDEPTTGLDPVMRDAFIDLVKRVKSQGTTILMSSHMFNELEPTCDRIGFLKDGRLVEILDQGRIRQIHAQQVARIKCRGLADYQKLLQAGFPVADQNGKTLELGLVFTDDQLPELLRLLERIRPAKLSFEEQSLNKYFEAELAEV